MKYRNFYVWPKRKGCFFVTIMAPEDFASAINEECLENSFEVIDIKALHDLEAKLAIAVKALVFYADSYTYGQGNGLSLEATRIRKDQGNFAREALNKIKE